MILNINNLSTLEVRDNFILKNLDQSNKSSIKIADFGTLDTSKETLSVKERVIRQLPGMYKNTRIIKHCTEVNSETKKLEYKQIKGLILNIQQRLSWYLILEENNIKCILIKTESKTFKKDLTEEDKKKGKFNYYIKAIFTRKEEEGGKHGKETEHQRTKFLVVPLYGLNISVNENKRGV